MAGSKPFDFQGSDDIDDYGQSAPVKKAPQDVKQIATAIEAGVRGRRTGLTAKTNVLKDADELDNIDDFFASPSPEHHSEQESQSLVLPPQPAKSAAKSGLKSAAHKSDLVSVVVVDPIEKEPKQTQKKTPAWAKRKVATVVVDEDGDDGDDNDKAKETKKQKQTEKVKSTRQQLSAKDDVSDPVPPPKKNETKSAGKKANGKDINIHHHDADIASLPKDGLTHLRSPGPLPTSPDIGDVVQRLDFRDEYPSKSSKGNHPTKPPAAVKKDVKGKSKAKEETTTKAPKRKRVEQETTSHTTAEDKKSSKHSKNEEKKKEEKAKQEEEEVDQHEARKSKRQRVAPLAFWKGEKIVYKEELLANQAAVPSIARVIRSDSPDVALVKRQKRTQSKHAQQMPSTPVLQEKGFLKADAVGLIHAKNASGKEQDQQLLSLGKQVQLTKTGDVMMSKEFETPAFHAGYLTIPLDGSKKAANSSNLHLVFHVQKGIAGVTINKTKIALTEGDMFYVPPKNDYKLDNLSSSDELKFLFFQVPM